MRKILKLTAILLILAGNFSSCGEEEPKEISFTEYSLVGTSCQWTNLDYEGKVIVINSNEELAQYITCTEESFPEIDFSKNTLLLASGGSGDVRRINTTLFKKSTNEYSLNVTIHLGIATVVLTWNIAILTPKISSNAIIILEKQETHY